MITIEYDDYLEIVRNLKKIKSKENIDFAINKLEKIIDKIRMTNRSMNDGRD